MGDLVVEHARSRTISCGSNYPEFPDGCVAVEFGLSPGSYPKNSDNCHHLNIPTTRATPPQRLGARRTGRPKRLNAVEPFAGLVAAVPTLAGLVTAPRTRARQPLSVLRAPRARASLPGPHQARRAARRAEPELACPTNVWMGVSVENADNHRALGLARPVGSGPGGDPSPKSLGGLTQHAPHRQPDGAQSTRVKPMLPRPTIEAFDRRLGHAA